MMYGLTVEEYRDLENRFTYHTPKGDQQERYVALRTMALALAEDISHSVPPGRERALALTNLEQSIFWANAGIARGE
jgi:hypothetical protein